MPTDWKESVALEQVWICSTMGCSTMGLTLLTHKRNSFGLAEPLLIRHQAAVVSKDNTMLLKLTRTTVKCKQGQMAITERTWCDFIVFTEKSTKT